MAKLVHLLKAEVTDQQYVVGIYIAYAGMNKQAPYACTTYPHYTTHTPHSVPHTTHTHTDACIHTHRRMHAHTHTCTHAFICDMMSIIVSDVAYR